MEGAYGAQIVKVLSGQTYQLEEGLLEQVLLKPEIKDLPVVVVSVAGAYRGGKSFLLNFFIRYLSASETARVDGSWLGEHSEPLSGFRWRGGVERTTSGILLWSEPFIIRLASGDQVSVILMDTQGTFDSTSTVRDNSTIFALSTLLSSVQIYNLSRNIQENDLQYLQLFTTYGKMVHEMHHMGKPFQTLEFLVRDWPYPYDYEYGAQGGRRLLQDRLEVNPDQPTELQELRTHIRSCFDNVLCYLMPHPGLKVLAANFKGNISDIDFDFKFHLKKLVSSLFSAENLTPKTINGQRVTAGDLYNYFRAYITLFNSDQIPSPRSIAQVTVEASLLSTMNKSREVYEKGMNAECGSNQPALPTTHIIVLHMKYLNAAKTAFTNQRTMATQEQVYKNLEKLTKELNDRLPQFVQSNLSKLLAVKQQAIDIYEEKILNVHKNQPLCLHPLDLENLHKEAVLAAMEYYDGHVKKIGLTPDDKRAELIHIFSDRFLQLKLTNDINNKDIVNELKEKYWQFMDTQSLNPPLPDADFERAHESGLNHAIAMLQAKRNRYSSYPTDNFKEELVELMKYVYVRLQSINHSKIEQTKMKQQLEQKRTEQEKINFELQKVREEQFRKEKELEVNKVNQEIARIEQERWRLEIERLRIEEENQRHRHRGSGLMGIVSTVATAVLSKFF